MSLIQTYIIMIFNSLFMFLELIGFARLCPGDTYEIQIKYGTNAKYRARTKIAKDGTQIWDASQKFSFKITVHDLLLIKINEIKFLGKNLLIGERICDTKDLFSTTQTQRLTLNANTSGTIKLSILITWLPFENCEEAFIYYNPTQYLTMNNKEKRLSSYKMNKLSSSVSGTSHSEPTTPTAPLTSTEYTSSTLQIRQNTASILNNINELPVISAYSACSSASTTLTSTSSCTNTASGTFSHTSIQSSSKLLEVIKDDGDETDNKSSMSISSAESSSSSSQLSQSNIHPDVESLLNDLIDRIDLEEDSNSVLRKHLEGLFSKLQLLLEELKSNYIELNDLSNLIQNFKVNTKPENILKVQNLNETSDIEIKNKNDENYDNLSIVLDDVLQYFDFLNAETYADIDETDCDENVNYLTFTSNNSMGEVVLPSTDTSSSTALNENLIENTCFIGELDQLLIVHFSVLMGLLQVRK